MKHSTVDLIIATLDLINMNEKECTVGNVRNITGRVSFMPTIADFSTGCANFLVWNEKGIVLALTSEGKADTLTGIGFEGKTIVLPSDSNYQSFLWSYIQEAKAMLRPWFEQFSRGEVQDSNLVHLTRSLNPQIVAASRIGHPFCTRLELIFDERDFRQYLVINCIVKPFMNGEGEILSRVRACQQCGKFFYAHKGDRVFCDSSCRNRFNYMKDKEKKEDNQ